MPISLEKVLYDILTWSEERLQMGRTFERNSMIRSLGLALGLFLELWGAFLFCTKDIVLRYNPDWIPTEGAFAQFFQVVEGQQHLVIEQWVAILIGSVGAAMFVYSLGMGRTKRVKVKKVKKSAGGY